VKETFGPLGIGAIHVPVRTEAEISQFDSDEERQSFMKELGITEPAIDKLNRVCCESLGSENKLKEAGKLYLKGKGCVVEDGDIIDFRFSV